MWWCWIALLDQNKQLALQLLIHSPPWIKPLQIKNITRNKEDMSKLNVLFKRPREPDPLPSRKGKVSLTIQTVPQWKVPDDVTKDVLWRYIHNL